MSTSLLKGIAVSLLMAFCSHGFAGQDEMDIDTRFRAKIAKAKLKVAAAERKNAEEGGGGQGGSSANCGSQSIGNVESAGIGRTPREVFVFAPNAINLVSGRGCR